MKPGREKSALIGTSLAESLDSGDDLGKPDQSPFPEGCVAGYVTALNSAAQSPQVDAEPVGSFVELDELLGGFVVVHQRASGESATRSSSHGPLVKLTMSIVPWSSHSR